MTTPAPRRMDWPSLCLNLGLTTLFSALYYTFVPLDFEQKLLLILLVFYVVVREAALTGPGRQRPGPGSVAIAFVLTLLIGLLFMRHVGRSFGYLFAILAVDFVLLAMALRKQGLKIVAVNMAAVFFALAVAEHFIVPPSKGFVQTYEVKDIGAGGKDFVRRKTTQADPLLGYRPISPSVIREDKRKGDRVVMHAEYQIDRFGMRATDKSNIAPDAQAILFFGGSFIFGEGVVTGDSMAAVAEQASGGKIDVLNHGFYGYGAHQMLAILEKGREQPPLGSREPKLAVYLGIDDHERRATGMTHWDGAGPWFVLEGNALVHKGAFSASRRIRLLQSLQHSSNLFARLIAPRLLSERTKTTYAAIVARAKEIFEQRHGGRFVVLYWDETPASEPLISLLEARGVEVTRVSALIPDLREHPEKYVIEGDTHPNPAAHRIMGAHVASLLKQ